MASFAKGDRVKIVARELTSADAKSGLYYEYFGNLIGTVDHVYEDKSVCVKVDQDSLPVDIQKRHLEVQEAVRTRWLNGLGTEQRERLSETDRSVVLGYNILVGTADLEPAGKAKPAPKPKAEAAAKPKAETAKKSGEAEPKRPTENDISKAEEEYLKKMAENK